jgi:hypothetical protein
MNSLIDWLTRIPSSIQRPSRLTITTVHTNTTIGSRSSPLTTRPRLRLLEAGHDGLEVLALLLIRHEVQRRVAFRIHERRIRTGLQ